jgi:carbon storage regulator
MGLVLTRKEGEKVYLGESVIITGIAIGGGKVQLLIEAPRDLPIYRSETRPEQPPPASGQDREGGE